jgi:hypothetical protein
MTRKHFTDIASRFNRRYRDSSPEERATLLLIMGDLADIFKQVNPNFDRYRFYEACTDVEE